MKPAVDAGLIDRYIAAAELARMDSAVVLNKCDLDEGGVFAANLLPEYEVLGYACHRTRAKDTSDLVSLDQHLAGAIWWCRFHSLICSDWGCAGK